MNNALLIYSKEVRNRIHINQLVQLSLPQLHCPRTSLSLSLSVGRQWGAISSEAQPGKEKKKTNNIFKDFSFHFLRPPAEHPSQIQGHESTRASAAEIQSGQKKETTFYSPYIKIVAQMSLSHRRETFPSLNMPLQSSELRTITPGRRRAECRATPLQAQARCRASWQRHHRTSTRRLRRCSRVGARNRSRAVNF